MSRIINISFEVPDDVTFSEFKEIALFDDVEGKFKLKSAVVLDEDDDLELDQYLIYLQSYIHSLDQSDHEDKISPMTYEQWVICGKPCNHIPGISFNGNTVLYVYDRNSGEKPIGYYEVNERMAEYLVQHAYYARPEGPSGREESETGDDNPSE